MPKHPAPKPEDEPHKPEVVRYASPVCYANWEEDEPEPPKPLTPPRTKKLTRPKKQP